MTNIKTKTAAVATAVGLSLGAAAYATAASGPSTHADETPLTGDVAAKVKEAALTKVPGATVLRVETDAGGVYEAHLKQADGTEVEVHVGKDYNVTSVDTRPAGGHRGRGHGHGRFDTAALAKALGVTEAKLAAALDAARPSGATPGDRHADEAAALAQALGESTADVQAVLDATHDQGGHRGGDRDALAKALAAEFGITQAKAQSALDAAHGAREDAFAATLAKALGLDAAKVKTALAAQHPDHP